MIRVHKWLVLVFSTGTLLLWPLTCLAECRKVGAVDFVTMRPQELKDLREMGVTRPRLFEALKDISIPETRGCWGGATGNFDDQLISVGTLQWNFGQKSLQPVLRRYKAGFRSDLAFQQKLRNVMPQYGRLLFSGGCLKQPITTDCEQSILRLQDNSRLDSTFRSELDALFETNPMIQIQVDLFVAMLQSVREDLKRIFPKDTPTLRQIKWAVDTKVQQGKFPGNRDIARVRSTWARLTASDRAATLHHMVRWYEALSNSIDQEGTRLDWKWNVERWNKLIDSKQINDEQADLLNISFIRSRTASVMSGHWQAVTFQRRAKVILGVGSLGGNKVTAE